MIREMRERRGQKTVCVRPAIELLFDLHQLHEIWPEEITQHEAFLSQIESRAQLNEQLNVVFRQLSRPDISLQRAIEDGNLTEDVVAGLYHSLTNLLVPDSEYQRVLLYLPFEFLPNTSWKPHSTRLAQAIQEFRTAYLGAWEELLRVHNVRANFVDGDVMDIEKRTGDLPRVVKAAHLIPKLVEIGFLNVKEVLRRMDETEDELLRQSIEDTLPVLRDMGLLEGGDDSKTAVKETGRVTLTHIETQLQHDFAAIDAQMYDDVTKKRAAWLRQEKKRKAVDSTSVIIQEAVHAGTLEAFDLETASVSAKQAYIDGIRKAIEANARENETEARRLLSTYTEIFESLWKTNESALQESLAKLFFHLHALGFVSDEELAEHRLVMPILEGPLSENLKRLTQETIEIKQILEAIERDPEISALIFPVVLIYGSRLKGYGSPQSDIDVAVIVKPYTRESDKARMRSLLKQLFNNKHIGGEITEFWTQEDGSHLRILDPDSYDPMIGESYWTHVLFGSAWEGKQKAIEELRAKLLTPYFYDDEKVVHGRNVRGLGLEELERDTLQYRLMHKGYEKFYPSFGGIQTPHADAIDGQSLFWDSGYRRMATKLYASRVFLPKLKHLSK